MTDAQRQIKQARKELKRRRELEKRERFYSLLDRAGIPRPQAEYRFHPTRRWRMDYAWPDEKVFIEVEGGVWTGGRHTRAKGFLNDIEKYNTAISMGWRGPLRTTPSGLTAPEFIALIKETVGEN